MLYSIVSAEDASTYVTCCDEYLGVKAMFDFDSMPYYLLTSQNEVTRIEQWLNEIHAARLLCSMLDLPEFLLSDKTMMPKHA